MDLSEIFLHILETHHLTQRKASSILQYSSPNQLQRITKKEVSDKLMMDFGERLLIHREELDLTPDEIVSIRQCLFFPSMKKPDYNYAACLFATLCTSVPVSQTKELHVQSVSGSQIHHFHQHLSNASRVHIEIIGCDMLFMRDTLEMLANQCNLTVNHYYLENQSSALYHPSAEYFLEFFS